MKKIFVACFLSLYSITDLSAQDIYHDEIPNPDIIASAQKCKNWCWAAAAEMLARSQGVDIEQEFFVKKIYGPKLPCLPTFGSFEPIKRALKGTYKLSDGRTIELDGAYAYGIPTNPVGMIRSIKEGRPFIFAAGGHAYVAYGVYWYRPTPTTVRIIQIDLIDPLYSFGNPKYTFFHVYQHPLSAINGTFELFIREHEPKRQHN